MDAGWETRSVDIYGESLVFVRTRSSARGRSARAAPARRSGAAPHKAQAPFVASTGAATLLEYKFVHAAAIQPDRGPDGALLEFRPQSRYDAADTTPLNRWGKGPFCRFDVEGLPPRPGVYAVTVGGILAYVGISTDLERRWGPRGYARISPRNCFVGGQSTNCKVNHLILQAARQERRVDLWMYETAAPKPIESRLIDELDPPWNGHHPRPIAGASDSNP